jgi:hypothetical protein
LAIRTTAAEEGKVWTATSSIHEETVKRPEKMMSWGCMEFLGKGEMMKRIRY